MAWAVLERLVPDSGASGRGEADFAERRAETPSLSEPAPYPAVGETKEGLNSLQFNNPATQQLNNSTTQQLNNSTTQQPSVPLGALCALCGIMK